MSSSEQLFQSVIQPLRLAQIADVGFSGRDFIPVADDKKCVENVEPELPLKKEEEEINIKAKMEELRGLEHRNLKLLQDVLRILSSPAFQKIFDENNVEERVVLSVVDALEGYLPYQEEYVLKMTPDYLSEIGEGVSKKDEALSKIGVWYPSQFLPIQKAFICVFPELFALYAILTRSCYEKKMEALLNKESADIQEVIKKGQLLARIMQSVTRRELLLKDFYVAIPKGHIHNPEIERVYRDAMKVSGFANTMMERAQSIKQDVNNNPYCLRKVLCNKEYFSELMKMAEGDDKTSRALGFLKELSVLIEDKHFLDKTPQAQWFALQNLGMKITDGRAFKDLIDPTTEQLKQVSPLLERFVQSDFFKREAKLVKGENESDKSYQERLDRAAAYGGELIILYKEILSKEALKESKEEAKEQGKEEIGKEVNGESSEMKENNGEGEKREEIKDQNQSEVQKKVEVAADEFVEAPVLGGDGHGAEGQREPESAQIIAENGKKEIASQNSDNGQGESIENRNQSEVKVTVQGFVEVPVLVGDGHGAERQRESESAEIIAEGEKEEIASKNSDNAPLMLHYLNVAAERIGVFVDKYPEAAMAIAVVSCLAVGLGIGIATGGVGIAVTAAVVVSTLGVWCSIFSNKISQSGDSQKRPGFTFGDMMCGYDVMWGPY